MGSFMWVAGKKDCLPHPANNHLSRHLRLLPSTNANLRALRGSRGALVLALAHSGAWVPLAAFPSSARGMLLAPAPGPQPACVLAAAGARLQLLCLSARASASRGAAPCQPCPRESRIAHSLRCP